MDQAKQAKQNKWIAIGSLALCGALVLCAFTAKGSAQTTDSGTETLYRESTVTRGDITVGVTETATATLKTHALSFDFSGEIDQVFVKAGQAVKEGDPIASITTDDLQDQIDDLRASYQEAALKLSDAQLSKQKGELSAKNTYDSTLNKGETADLEYELAVDKLEQSIKDAQRSIDEIKRELTTYDLILRYADFDEEESGNTTSEDGDYLGDYASTSTSYDYTQSASYDASYDKNFKSDTQVNSAIEDAQLRMESAESTLKQAEYNLEIQAKEATLAKSQSQSAAEIADSTYDLEVQSLENTISSKQLELSSLQKQISKASAEMANNVLYAPCDGLVTALSVQEGDTVQEGTAAATLSDSGSVFVYVAVTQDDITGITMGQSCSVTMDAFDALPFEGTVDSITTTPARSASSSASYNVTIKLEGDTAQVYEGMSGSATLITRQQKDVLTVTNRTVFERDGQSYVKVKREDGSVEEVPVTTGFSDGRNVEVTQGLEEGWTVLIESQVSGQAGS